MKRFLFFVVFFFASFFSFSQDEIEIVGKWKLVSISDEEVYYNLEKDSFLLKTGSDASRFSAFAEDSSNIAIKKFLSQTPGKMTVEFRRDMTCEFEGNIGGISDATYEIQNKKKIIKLKEVLGTGEVRDDTIKYELKNGKLFLFINEESGSIVEFKKEKSF